MFAVRIHGRGGQGVITAAELIAIAGWQSGLETQALPAFGVERTGAPIQAFARLANQPILTREHIYTPDFIIIQDATLLEATDILAGANKTTKIIINTPLTASEILAEIKKQKTQSFIPNLKNIFTIDATKIALKIFGKNLVNTAILGAFAKVSGVITIAALKKAIQEKFLEKGPEIIEKNIKAALTAEE